MGKEGSTDMQNDEEDLSHFSSTRANNYQILVRARTPVHSTRHSYKV